MKDEFNEIAKSVEKLSKLGEDIFKSRLTDNAVLILVGKVSGVKKANVKAVLDALPKLKNHFLKDTNNEQDNSN